MRQKSLWSHLLWDFLCGGSRVTASRWTFEYNGHHSAPTWTAQSMLYDTHCDLIPCSHRSFVRGSLCTTKQRSVITVTPFTEASHRKPENLCTTNLNKGLYPEARCPDASLPAFVFAVSGWWRTRVMICMNQYTVS